MEKSTSTTFGQRFSVAATAFGAIIGPGAASGTTILYYFVNKGWKSSYLPLLSFLVAYSSYYWGMEYSRMNGITVYNEMFNSLYGKYKKFVSPLMDITMIWALYNGASILCSQVGIIASTIFGINKWILIIAIVIIGIVGSMFGASGFRRVQGVLTIVLLVSMLLIFGGAIFTNGSNAISLVTERWMPDGATVSNAVYWGAMYGVANISFIGVLLPSNDILKKKADVKHTLVLGYIMNTCITLLSCWALLSYAPGIVSEGVPFLFISKDVFPGVGVTIYILTLLGAIITTIVGFCYTIGTRFKPLLQKKISNERVCGAIPALVLMVAGALTTELGLNFIFTKMTAANNIFILVFLFIPLIIIAPIQVRKMRREKSAPNTTPDSVI